MTRLARALLWIGTAWTVTAGAAMLHRWWNRRPPSAAADPWADGNYGIRSRGV